MAFPLQNCELNYTLTNGWKNSIKLHFSMKACEICAYLPYWFISAKGQSLAVSFWQLTLSDMG